MSLHQTTAIAVITVAVSLFSGCGGTPSQSAVPQVTVVTIGDGEAAIEKGDFESASDIFSQLIADAPNDPILRYYLGLCRDNLGDTAGAIAGYQKALELDTNLTNARLNLGLVYFHQEKLDLAAAEFEAVAEAEPHAADVQFNLAMVLAAQGNLDSAKAHYKKCISLAPDDPDPVIALGNIAKDADQLDVALAYFDKAAAIGAGSAAAVLSAAQILAAQQKKDQAVEKLLSVTEMSTDAETLASAGLLLTKLGKPDDAITVYKHTAEVAPNYVQVYILMGNATARQGHFEEAAGYFEKVIQISPDSPEAVTAAKGLAACKTQLGQKRE